MRYYLYRPDRLDKITHKKPSLQPASNFWIVLLMTMLLLFAIALLNRGF
jgi:hypothetical protein